MAMVPSRRPRRVGAALAAVFLAAACSSTAGDGSGGEPGGSGPAASAGVDEGARTRVTSADGRLTLETTSTRAGLVSGGDVLVSLSGDAASEASVSVDGEDVTGAFGAPDAGGVRRSLVEGLTEGDSTVEVVAGDTTVSLAVTNHPKNGPVFAGPHLEPWVCTTEAAGLGPARDDDCDAPSTTTWSYRATDGSVKPLADPGDRPADLATTTVGGVDVPFVIRTERGVIDRGVATIWVLDPDVATRATGERWSPKGWNGRLVYRFGGGCGTQYSQGSSLGVDLDTDLLARGYAVATNTLDTFQTACNDVLSAEAMLMTREHFVERYGVPRFTIGDGGSGGAIQQLLLASNYPGLLDAVSASVPFPDAVSVAPEVTDCGLLLEYFATPAGSALTPGQRTAITGHASLGTCALWSRLFLPNLDPTVGCAPEIADEVYDPQARPDGVRCTMQDSNVAVLGRDPATGFARRPLDNVGVRYGLQALRDEAISGEQFLDLNERVGGYDIDGRPQRQRHEADAESLATTYGTGRLSRGDVLADLPVVLRNVDTDEQGDIHTRVWPFAIRERLRGADGQDAPNLLLWTLPSAGDLAATLTGAIGDINEPVTLLDEWLTTGTRPAAARNRCTLPDGENLEGGWELYDEPGPCRDAYPVHGTPRTVAGQPIAAETVKCALRPVEAADAEGVLTGSQLDRLASIFPDGVCDWSQPGPGQGAPDGTWQSYGT